MVLLNLWSVGHFCQWFLVGRLLNLSWTLFLILSIGWELLELILPYEFANETWDNKISDIVVNCCGFYLGNLFKQGS
ncbi:MAG: hypothetical protein ACPGTT_05235 [Candidatus Poseidoniaceae archaeon]